MVIFFLSCRNLPRPQNEQQSPTRQRVQSYYGLPYVKGLCEQLRRCLQQQGVRAVFKSEITLKSQLVRPKDAVDQDRNAPIRAVEKQQITAEHHAL